MRALPLTRRAAAAAAALLLAACSGDGHAVADAITPIVEPPLVPWRGGGTLDGTWTGSDAGGLVVTLTLAQHGDSVTGAGTYARPATGYANRCGGSTIPVSGAVRLVGVVPGDTLLQAGTRFDLGNGGDWGPPYIAVRTARDTLTGWFMSVDVGPCPLVLARTS